MQRVLFIGISLLLILIGCTTQDPDPVPETGNSGTTQEQSSVIRWPRDPYHVIFRAELRGGDDENAFYRKNEIPPCTVYGDGRVVWTVRRSTGTDQILFDFLNDQQIINFVSYLTINERIYTYDEGINFRVPTEVTPVYEVLTLHVNDQEHITDVFSDWGREYYLRVLNACQTLSDTPTEFVPDGAWVSAVPVEMNMNAPMQFWNPSASGLSIADLADNEEKRWIEGRNVTALWAVLQDNPPDIQFEENDQTYQIALEIPGVTISAPPAPVDTSVTPEPLPLS